MLACSYTPIDFRVPWIRHIAGYIWRIKVAVPTQRQATFLALIASLTAEDLALIQQDLRQPIYDCKTSPGGGIPHTLDGLTMELL